MYATKFTKAAVLTFAALCVVLLGGAMTNAVASDNLLQNGSFNGSLNGWIVNPALQTGTPPWTPLLADGSGVSLHPVSYSFKGTILYQNLNQNLNVTGIAEKQVTLQARLWQVYSPPYQNTVAFYLTYVDNTGAFHRVKVYNPLNSDISIDPAASTVSASYPFDGSASKLVKLEIVKEGDGEFHVDDVALSADGLTSGTIPALSTISATSGPYGTALTITGVNFGTTAGKVAIGGVSVTVNSWSDTSISVTPVAPAHSGNVIVIADGVESNPSQTFTVTSPCFNVELVTYSAKVIQGQQAEFLIKTSFFNHFTTTDGITLRLQGGDAETLSDKTSFALVPIKSPGGAILRIATGNLAAGNYTADIVAVNGAQSIPAGTLKLQVVTVTNIKFYEMIYDSVTYASTRVDYDAEHPKTASAQGQLLIYTDVIGSDGQIFSSDFGDNGVVLTEDSASAPILGIYKRFWGYEIYAQENGGTKLRATTPDGYTAALPITVSFSTDSYITSIGLTAPTGAASLVGVNTVYNNRTDPITFYASGSAAIGWIGYDTSGLGNFQMDFLDKGIYSSDNKSVTLTFNLLNLPADIGTALLHASTASGKASAVVPLTTVNDPATGLLAFFIRSLDSNAFAEMFKIYFYGASDNQLKFTKEIWTMHMGNKPVLVGNIPSGSYKILFAPGSVSPGMDSAKPQWWPNAATMDSAAPVTFEADKTTSDIYYFLMPQPSGAKVTLPAPASKYFTSPQGGAGSIQFSVNDQGFVWAATSDSPWLRITNATGTGNGTVSYAVDANPDGASRTGTITIAGQTFTVTQWGTGNLYGYVMLGNATYPSNWYNWKTELGTAEFQSDKIHNVYKESADICPDSHYCQSSDTSDLPFAKLSPELLFVANKALFASSNDQNAFLADLTGAAERGLAVGVKLDAAKSYTKADVSGDYYVVGYEYDSKGYDKGKNRVSTEVSRGDGNGTLTGAAKLACNGNICVGGYFQETTSTSMSYDIQSPGVLRLGPDANTLVDMGYVGAGGKALVVANPTKFYPDFGDDFMALVGVKKGDKGYSNADLQGNWVFSSFGDEGGVVFSEFGVLACNGAGDCQIRSKHSENGDIRYKDESVSLGTVSWDGSLNGFYVQEGLTGAIGDNGNMLIFTITGPTHRQMGVAIKSDMFMAKGDLNGDGGVDLADAIVALRLLAGENPTNMSPYYRLFRTDVNNDGQAGLQELLYILQRSAALRQ